MRENHSFIDAYRRAHQQVNECTKVKSLIEICGNKRVLVEHHLGILDYNHNDILVKLTCGSAHVCGQKLELKLLSKEKLIISGNISCITLEQE